VYLGSKKLGVLLGLLSVNFFALLGSPMLSKLNILWDCTILGSLRIAWKTGGAGGG